MTGHAVMLVLMLVLLMVLVMAMLVLENRGVCTESGLCLQPTEFQIGAAFHRELQL